MKELYRKVLNGEIDVKYLSPIDLIKLEKYLTKLEKKGSFLLKYYQIQNKKIKNEIAILKDKIESDN